MSAHVLLNSLNEIRKRDITRDSPSIVSFFATSVINSIIQDIEITLKSHFSAVKCYNLSLCTQRCYGRHNVS